MAAKTDPWVRFFDVSETKRHPKGYTIYQVKSTVSLHRRVCAGVYKMVDMCVWERDIEVVSAEGRD